ncbi:MAG: carboxypeptidase regulatory-like domain-containing protein [Dehalococcoidia bacterium]
MTEGQNTANIDFSLDTGGKISGTVTDSGGSPIEDAWIEACPYDGPNCEDAYTGSDGRYTISSLATGNYRVEAGASGYILEYYDGVRDWNVATPVSAVEGSETPNIDFSLDAGGSLSGTVTNAQGVPVQDAYVCAEPSDFMGSNGCAYSGQDGGYTIGGLASDNYAVYAEAGGYAIDYYDGAANWDTLTPVSVLEGQETSGIDFSLHVEGTISGTVYDSAGKPIARAWVDVCPYQASGDCMSAETMGDGTYSVGGLSTGSYVVEAAADGYVWEYYDNVPRWGDATPVSVTEGKDSPGIDFSLDLAGTISGTVTDGTNPVSGGWVWACSDNDCNSASTAHDGTYIVTNLAADDYRVEAEANGYLMQYYKNTPDYGSASPVHVNLGQETPDVDFSLQAIPTHVKIDPPARTISLAAGSSTVNVKIDNVTNLGSFQFDVVFDPAIVQLQSFAEGPFLKSTGRSTICSSSDIAPGAKRYACASGGSQAGPNGSGVLATLTFSPVAAGTSAVDLANWSLADATIDVNAIEAIWQNGSLTVANCAYDADGNGMINIRDVQLVFAHWPSPPRVMDARYDVDGDGDIDIRDVQLVFGHWPSPPRTYCK